MNGERQLTLIELTSIEIYSDLTKFDLFSLFDESFKTRAIFFYWRGDVD